jgi:hypothetical protein
MTTMPVGWETEEVLDGLDILDKSQLVDVPLRILGCAFKPNNENVSICYIDAERSDGYAFTFLDSSTGVRAQIVKYLSDKGLDAAVDSGEYVEFKLVAPQGLRLSEYEIPVKAPNGQPIPGKVRLARTYYLTTSGKRGARGKASDTTAAAPKQAATKTR